MATNLDAICAQTGLTLTEDDVIATAMRVGSTVRGMLEDDEVAHLWPSIRSFLRGSADDWETPEEEWRAFLVAEYIDLATDVAAQVGRSPDVMEAAVRVVDAVVQAMVEYLRGCGEVGGDGTETQG